MTVPVIGASDRIESPEGTRRFGPSEPTAEGAAAPWASVAATCSVYTPDGPLIALHTSERAPAANVWFVAIVATVAPEGSLTGAGRLVAAARVKSGTAASVGRASGEGRG